MTSAELEKLKADLLLKDHIDKLVSGEENFERKAGAGVADIPVKKMHDQIQYIDKELLPRIEKKGGKKTADYEFFSQVRLSLIWAVILVDRHDFLNFRLVREKLGHTLCREHCELLEREITKYCTLEDLFLTTGLDHIARGVKDRVGALLKDAKPP
jgi:hypothetical protein